MPKAGPIRRNALPALLCAIAAALFLAGCAEKKPPAAPAPLVSAPPPLQATHLPGGVIVRTPAPSPPYDDPMAIHVSYYATDHMPPVPGISIGGTTRLIIVDQAEAPLRPSAELTRNAMLIDNAGRLAESLAAASPAFAVPLGQVDGLLPRGITFSTRLDDPASGHDPASVMPTRRYVRLDVSRAAPAASPATTRAVATTAPVGPRLQLAVTMAGAASPQASIRRETAVLDTAVPASGRPFAVAVPFSLTGSRAGAIVIVVELTSLDGRTPSPDLLARVGRDLKQGAAATRPTGQLALTEASANASFVAGVLPGLMREDRQRASLAFLADSVDAPLTRDLAIASDDKTLSLLCDRVIANLTAGGASFDRDGVAWILENASLRLLAEQQSARTLPKPLEAVLAIHAGEAGRHEGSIDEILKNAHGRNELATALTNENVILLSDSSPASRVRAYDWLAGRGVAPEGYDPLGPPRQRQAAVDRWIERHAASAASQPATKPATTTATKP